METTFMLPSNGIGLAPTVILIVVGLGAAFHFFFPRQSQPKLNRGLAIGIVVSLLAGGALAANFLNPNPPAITIGQGEVSINTQVPGVGAMSFSSADMKEAYVQSMGSGVLASMSKEIGTNMGDYNVGTFVLGNGATAYVVTDAANNVVVALNDGSYLVLGPPSNNFTGFVNLFSEDVMQVSNST